MPQPRESSSCQDFFKHWIRWAGPPDVLVCDGERGLGASEIFTEKLSVSGTQVQTKAAYSPWQKGRVEHRIATIKEVAGKTMMQHHVAGRSATSVVSYEVAHALNQRAGMLGILLFTRVFGLRTNVYGELMEHGEVVPHPTVVDEGDELARRFIIRVSARKDLEEHAASEAIRRAAATHSRAMKTFEPGTLCVFHRHYTGKRAETAMRGRYLGPADLMGPYGRSSWWVLFGRKAYLCDSEHLREVTPDEAECSGFHQRRQLDEEDLTSQPGPPPSVEVPAESPIEPVEPSRDDLDIGMDAVEQRTNLEGVGGTESSTEIGEQSIS